MVPEIWFMSAADIIFSNFGPFFALPLPLPPPPPPLPNNPENQSFEKIKMKESHGDIIILHMFTVNYNHMMHGT